MNYLEDLQFPPDFIFVCFCFVCLIYVLLRTDDLNSFCSVYFFIFSFFLIGSKTAVI